jgi:hypothetical protein
MPDINDAINLLLGTSHARNTDIDAFYSTPDEIWTEGSGGTHVVLIGVTAANSNTIGVYTDLKTGGGSGSVRTAVLGPESGFGFAGDGTMADPFPASVTTLAPGTAFGWYPNTVSGGTSTNYFSESALNPYGLDHMMTFDLTPLDGKTIYVTLPSAIDPIEITLNDPYLIAWEDLPASWVSVPNKRHQQLKLGDEDYDDMMYIMMYIVDRINIEPSPTPIANPEPSTLAVWSILGLTIAGACRYRAKRGAAR